MCYQPITIKTPQGYRTVPCGHCLECLRKYQSDWSNRMFEELKSHNGKAVFFTLTYDEDNVPKNYLYDYQIFRSPSDYGFDNTYVDEKGKERVKPEFKGQRKHRRVSPSVELEEIGLDCSKIIDFNVKRDNHKQFMASIKKIYADYLDTITTTRLDSDNTVSSSCTDGSNTNPYSYDFDGFEGDYFEFQEEIKEVVEDDDYLAVQQLDGYRERPIMMFNSVRKKDVQDWIKRARERRRKDAKKTGMPEQTFSFYITSEYGPRTLRPHYHGVLFGVTVRDTMDMVVDWQKHHGRRISWDNVDLSKGDMSYCAKYCSKGFYEHPLCSKDFFYPKAIKKDDVDIRPFTEYHSKHYERCIELFGMDEPIVDPTFHLVSKGLGVDWVENNTYLVADFKDVDFKDTEVSPTIKVVRDSFRYESEPEQPDVSDYVETSDLTLFPSPSLTYDLSITSQVSEEEFEALKPKIKEIKSKDYEECISRLFERFKYHRSFKGQDIAYGVPKYYRTKILSDGLRSAFANYVQQVNVELYQEKLEALRTDYPSWEDTEIVSYLEKQEIRDKYDRMRRVRERVSKQYDKSRI